MKKQYESPWVTFSFVFDNDVIRTSVGDGAKDVGVNGSEMTDWWNLSNK